MFALILASLAVVLAQTWRQPRALELREDGSVSWKDRYGAWHEASLGKNRFVSPFLVVVELGGDGPRRLVLLADSALADDFRRLRVWLRWHGSPREPRPE